VLRFISCVEWSVIALFAQFFGRICEQAVCKWDAYRERMVRFCGAVRVPHDGKDGND